jgi:methylthioribose-1-phosphate isomerase
MALRSGPPPAVAWIGGVDGYLRLLDQTLLPGTVETIDCRTVEQVWEAIRALRVRGAPAIGVAAAYGVVVGCQSARAGSPSAFAARLEQTLDYLASSRPTAVNLFWALDRLRRAAEAMPSSATAADILDRLWREAQAIEAEDRQMCAAIGRWGAPLLANCDGVLTHCNTGGLATAGEGTALAVIIAAARNNPQLRVYADETRPLLQGARLTTWELLQHGIDVCLICDAMAAWVMQQGRVQAVIVGADRIAANGDTANKIGTYGLSVLARAHGIPFYVAAPSSTFDRSLPDGSRIPIEERPAAEITQPFGRTIAPEGCPTYNPAFDVAPAANITAIITERGVIQPVEAEQIARVLSAAV